VKGFNTFWWKSLQGYWLTPSYTVLVSGFVSGHLLFKWPVGKTSQLWRDKLIVQLFNFFFHAPWNFFSSLFSFLSFPLLDSGIYSICFSIKTPIPKQFRWKIFHSPPVDGFKTWNFLHLTKKQFYVTFRGQTPRESSFFTCRL